MPAQENKTVGWAKLPVSLRAIVTGIVIALIPANVWPPLLLSLGVPAAATIEIAFLVPYPWWASGNGPSERTRRTRAFAFRSGPLSPAQWFLGNYCRVCFRGNDSCGNRAPVPFRALSGWGVSPWLRLVIHSLVAFEVDRRRDFGDLGRRLRRDRVSWLYAAPDRTTSWRGDSDSRVLIFLHAVTS